MLSDKEVEECARKTLGLDEEPDNVTPQFYLDSFKEHILLYPNDTNFIIELADPKRKEGGIGGNGFGVITCMEDYCWNDTILSADPNKPDGGRSDGFGSFSDYHDHCSEDDHVRGRSERCKYSGVNDKTHPQTQNHSSSSFSSSSSSNRPLPFSYSSSSSSSRHNPSTSTRTSILDLPSFARPSSSSTLVSGSYRPNPLSSPPLTTIPSYASRRMASSPTYPSSRYPIDVKPIPTQYRPSSSSAGWRRSIDVITISSSSPTGSDNEYDENALDDDDEDGVIPLDEDEIPDEYKRVTNKDNPILLSDSDEDDIQVKSRGKGQPVSRTGSSRIPLAPIFTLSQGKKDPGSSQSEGGIEMVRDDSGSSITERQKAFDALFSTSTSTSSRNNQKYQDGSSSNRIQALSAEEKLKLREKETQQKSKPNDVKPDQAAIAQRQNPPFAQPFSDTNPSFRLAFYRAEETLLSSTVVQGLCSKYPNLYSAVMNRRRTINILKPVASQRPYFPPSAALLALIPQLRNYIPPTYQAQPNAAAGSSAQINGTVSGTAGLEMPGGWNPELGGALPGMMTATAQEDDDLYGLGEEYDRPRSDEGLHTFFDENLKDFIEDTTVDESLKRLGLNSATDFLPDLRIKLMAHQILGVDFMVEKEKDKRYLGGINADAMGLGKTVQSIATIATHQSEDPKVKSTLIVAPLALLTQWKNEIESKTTPGFLRVLIYHGQKRVKSKANIKQYDVVLTTYGTLVAEFGPKEKRSKKNDSDDEEAYTDVRKQGPLLKVHWYRVILDEAHQIRNRNTRATKACFALKSYLRWCLTGTPIVNTLEDMYPYLHFLSISPAAKIEYFRGHISRMQKKRPKLATKRMQAIIRPFCIRRNKESELNGQKLLQLPPKNTEVVTLSFTDDERQIYTAIENRFKIRFNSYLRKGTVMKHYSVVLVMLLRLRQLTCHPWLLRRNPNDNVHAEDVLITDEDLMSGVDAVKADDTGELARATTLLGQEVVDKLKKIIAERQERIADSQNNPDASRETECPICSDEFNNERITPCGHSFCAECIEDVFNGPMNQADLGDADVQAGRRACPLCRSAIEKGKVFRADAFKPHNEEDDQSEIAEEDAVEGDIEAKLEAGEDDGYEEGDRKGKRKANGDVKPRLVKKKKPEQVKLDPDAEDPLADVAEDLTMDNVPPSTKMKRLGQLIDQVNEKDASDKIIIFSQFVEYIELCSLYLNRRGVKHVRYIGAMKQDEREKVLKEFNISTKLEPDSPKVILMSLKCGGVGLNLCAANHVVCLDLAWNAATENQAVDRAHRIGQEKAVSVHRLVIENTVEQRILDLQEKKQALSDGAMGEGGAGRLGRLSVRDLMRLFAVDGGGDD
ncbi:uncharacterized protein IL334_003890 [Kwoniella shivajii]|uniref:DNA repair protein RAD5 n=1 Tax=Kwoniella shivajii TaxID=564305 RepID=A0ABZ1CYU8_9TREE|nr:hypothetical protein IL334_003890 [Kwoniella shivajii]